ncbi:hypothetical protein AB0F13_05420 [Streptomyces sp. NPDC026206]|uniref:hypothetical protein n=1 Tax=Streptomyces sp. NPDC026206 TaxID=3157089 RepID=UPI00340EE51C
MAVKFVPVGEDQKDEPGVEEAVTTTTIGGQTITTTSYGRLIRHDDLMPDTTEGVFSVELLVPEMGTEEYETGEVHEDGTTPKIALRPCVSYTRREVDLGQESFEKYLEVVKPFADASREPQQVPAQARKRRAKSGI